MNEEKETYTQANFVTQKQAFRSWIESRNDSVMLHAIVHDLMEENKQLREKLSIRAPQ